AGNPAPDGLVDALGSRLRPALRRLAAAAGTEGVVAAAATRVAATLPALPASRVTVKALGPLGVWRAGEPVDDADLRRQRVRELLCFLIVRSRVRREEISAELWPGLDDRGRNLRVTLNYLQRVLQPERSPSDPPYFLRSIGPWLSFEGRDRLEVDVWAVDELLDEADRAERSGNPAGALAAYTRALPLWRGEPVARSGERS